MGSNHLKLKIIVKPKSNPMQTSEKIVQKNKFKMEEEGEKPENITSPKNQ